MFSANNAVDNWLVSEFERCNVVVYGAKGTGKDLLFAHVIHLRDDFHYSNMPYNFNSVVLKSLKCLSIGSNKFCDLVNGTLTKYNDYLLKGKDIYISDAGVYFGCQNNSELDNLYPSLAIFEALSRQLGQHNVHANLQSLTRLYIKMREQADSFIKCLKATDYGDFIAVNAISYDRLESAEANILPCMDKREKQRFADKNGEIEYRTFYIDKRELMYDTHYFARLLLNNYNGNSVKYYNNWSFKYERNAT